MHIIFFSIEVGIIWLKNIYTCTSTVMVFITIELAESNSKLKWYNCACLQSFPSLTHFILCLISPGDGDKIHHFRGEVQNSVNIVGALHDSNCVSVSVASPGHSPSKDDERVPAEYSYSISFSYFFISNSIFYCIVKQNVHQYSQFCCFPVNFADGLAREWTLNRYNIDTIQNLLWFFKQVSIPMML